MGKKSDKKTIIILLIVLAISTIGGGIWTYNSLKPLEISSDFLDTPDSFSTLNIEEVFAIKDEARQNIKDFLVVKISPNTIWEDFYTNNQFNRLQEIDVEINIDRYLNNPNPFVLPSFDDDSLE